MRATAHVPLPHGPDAASIGQHEEVTQVSGDGHGGVPGAPPAQRAAPADTLPELAQLISAGGVVILSGAGLSTESGIPDYRGPSGLARRAEPMTYQTFVSGAAARQKYWARSHLGWRHVAGAAPNLGHRAVADLERHGLLAGIITQNVDGLHQAAGARRMIELHGGLDRVVCLGCGARTPRERLAQRLRMANPGLEAQATQASPDGDAWLADDAVAHFRVLDCESCDGMLKPDVVFFGENVPRSRVEDCNAIVGRASALVVLGSSLTVMSGYRFVRLAARLAIPVAIINLGPTRGDAEASLTLNAPLGQTLAWLAARCGAGRQLTAGGYVPGMDDGPVVLGVERAQRAGIEPEQPPADWLEAQPAGRQHAEYVPVRHQRDIALGKHRPHPAEHRIGTGPDLVDGLARMSSPARDDPVTP
jgi:NAD-dependent SIR2 family protein deacetylase